MGIESTGTRDYEPFCGSWAWNWALCKGNSALNCEDSPVMQQSLHSLFHEGKKTGQK